MKTDFDILVVGGGLAGMSAALAAHAVGFKTGIIAKTTPISDGRTTALFMPSIDFLKSLDVWDAVKDNTSELKTMRILDGTSRLVRSRPASFHSSEIDLDAFGFNIPNKKLLDMLYAKMVEAGITIFDEFAADLKSGEACAEVLCKDGTSITAQHIIAADGRKSVMRDKVGIRHTSWSYPQKAIVLTFRHKLPHQNISTEFHRETGPFTQVPLPDVEPYDNKLRHRSSLVWAVGEQDDADLLSKSNAELSRIVEDQMQSLLGAVEIDTKPQCYPMSSLIAKSFGKDRVLLVGEAAHAFPPIGAQGLNLGLRDVITAIDCIKQGAAKPATVASEYDKKRRADVVTRTFGIDMFNRTLLTSFLPVQLIRSGTIAAVSSIPPLRHFMMRQGALPTGRLSKTLGQEDKQEQTA